MIEQKTTHLQKKIKIEQKGKKISKNFNFQNKNLLAFTVNIQYLAVYHWKQKFVKKCINLAFRSGVKKSLKFLKILFKHMSF